MYLNAISNRIAASSERSRYLGMVFGTLISQIVDPADKQLNFSLVQQDSPEYSKLRSLLNINDSVGTVQDLAIDGHGSPSGENKKAKGKVGGKQPTRAAKPSTSASSKVTSIEEVEDSGSDDDDLRVYGKIDSDAEESEEDIELVQRNKPKAPV